jgi:hypothetical protein
MNANITDANARKAYETLRASGPRGRELADVLGQRGTRVRVQPGLYGGFTLNIINTIFIMPLKPDTTDWDYNSWVTLLGHEACHVEQRYWVDSVQQEIRAYATQAVVAEELTIRIPYLDAFTHLNADSPNHQRLAQAALMGLFAATPAGLLYGALPLIQPTGLSACVPALHQFTALLRAALSKRSA